MDSGVERVLLITIDSLRADRLGILGNPGRLTPHIDRLADHGVVFSQAIANGPGTPQSFSSIMSSTYPLMYGGYGFLSEQRSSLAEIMKQEGFATAAFHSNPYLSNKFGYSRGFDTFRDYIDSEGFSSFFSTLRNIILKHVSKDSRFYQTLKYLSEQVPTDPKIRAEVINKGALSWIKEHRGKFFVWIHYMDVHYPYLPPKDFLDSGTRKHPRRSFFLLNEKALKGELTREEIDLLIDLYNAEVRYTDSAVGRLLESLENDGLLDGTMVILTSDHGEEFNEHGGFFHGQRMYDEILRVPLVVACPGILPGKVTNDTLVSLIDVAPTILEIAGLQREPRFLGSSLVPLMKADTTASEPVLSEDSSATNELTISPERQVISVRTPKWKYIHYAYKDPELYDLTTDPQEKINLARTRPHEEKYFRTIVLKHIETRYGRRPESEKERLKKGIAALIGKKKI